MAKQPTAGGNATRPKTSGARPVSSESATRKINTPSIGSFFQESRAELRKVTWPTRQEVLNLTTAVVVMTGALALFLGLFDTALDFLVKPIIGAK